MSLFVDWLELPPLEAGQRAQATINQAMNFLPSLDGEEFSPSHLQGDVIYQQDDFAMTRDGFWFQTPGGVRFLYHLGQAVRANSPAESSAEELELFLWGTVYGAVAWLNGLVPLHASSVAFADAEGPESELPRAVGFAGASGAGKSTLAAGLSARGARQLCDDTLVIVPSSGGLVALPDKKPLKLWQDSLSLLSMPALGDIMAVPGKSFAEPSKRQNNPCLLTELFMLEKGAKVGLEPVLGSAKLSLLFDSLYREVVYLQRTDNRSHGMIMTSLAGSLRVWRLRRPQDKTKFAEELVAVENSLRTALC